MKRQFLLTGANGFVGKTTLWHLLNRFPAEQLASVIVIVRSRGNISAADRFRQSFLKPFPELHEQVQAKVSVLDAHLTRPSLGLDRQALEQLHNGVTDVIHCAASVRFDAPLPQAKQANIDTLVNLLDCCRHFSRLQAFVHTSTAYVFPHPEPGRNRICREQLVTLPPQLMERFGNRIDRIVEAVAGNSITLADMQNWGFANSYTFTKAIAEHVLVTRAAGLPVTVVRPSIIAGAFSLPAPGWTDSYAALGAYLYAAARGLVPLVRANTATRTNVVPVDIVARSLIDAANRRHLAPRNREIDYRFAVTDSAKTIDVREITRISQQVFQHRRGRRWAGAPLLVQSKWLARILAFILDELPRRYRIRYLERRGKAREARKMRFLGSHAMKLSGQFYFFLSRSFDFVSEDSWDCGPSRSFHIPAAIICAGVVRYLLKQDTTATVLAGQDYRGYRPQWWSSALAVRGILFRRILAILASVVLKRSFTAITINYPHLLQQLAHVPEGAKLIVTPNHRSYFDFILMYFLFETRRELRFADMQAVATNKFRKVRLLAWLMTLNGVFFIERTPVRSDLQLYKKQISRIERHDGPLLMFPEGRRSRDGSLLPIKKGLLRMLAESRRPACFLPILISYERRADEAELREELNKAQPGKMKGARHALRWLGQALAGRISLGSVRMTVGELILADDGNKAASEINKQFLALEDNGAQRQAYSRSSSYPAVSERLAPLGNH